MTGLKMERRLTAILAADVVGYSRFMELDEAGTLTALERPVRFVDGPYLEVVRRARKGARVDMSRPCVA